MSSYHPGGAGANDDNMLSSGFSRAVGRHSKKRITICPKKRKLNQVELEARFYNIWCNQSGWTIFEG